MILDADENVLIVNGAVRVIVRHEHRKIGRQPFWCVLCLKIGVFPHREGYHFFDLLLICTWFHGIQLPFAVQLVKSGQVAVNLGNTTLLQLVFEMVKGECLDFHRSHGSID